MLLSMEHAEDQCVNLREEQKGPRTESPPAFNHIEAEYQRASARRKAMEIERPPDHEDVAWGLALSGGGIRSATFCLGVLQGLTQAEAPSQHSNEMDARAVLRRSMLPQFDYLSTVSGGGYIGSFFCSLFRKKRLNLEDDLDDRATAEQAYQVLREDPPGRLHGTEYFSPASPGKVPLAWLRENGCYIMPSGVERVDAVALAIRNWCAIHFVLGTVLGCLCVFWEFGYATITNVLDLTERPNYVRDFELLSLHAMLDGITDFWWSAAWFLIILPIVFWLAPVGLAFWMTHPKQELNLSSSPQRFSAASLNATLVGAALMALPWFGQHATGSEWHPVFQMLRVGGFIILLGVAWHTLTSFYPTISAQRAGLTRALSNAMVCTSVLVLFASVHTISQTMYAHYGSLLSWLANVDRTLIDDKVLEQSPVPVLMFVLSIVAIFAFAAHQLMGVLEEKERKGWTAKIPVHVLAGLILFLLVLMFWMQLALWIQWSGEPPNPLRLLDTSRQLEVQQVLANLFLSAFALMLVIGRAPELLNLSTFQDFYSTRITRAYMGASNGVRFRSTPGSRRFLSVTQDAPSDLMTLEQYYENPLAPMHLINVCMNQNVDPAEQLVQRDRKGKPLVILPTGFALEGVHHVMPETRNARHLRASLGVGEWIGVSGAAISTGMGRGGSGGGAMLNGLANLRLGRWWESGVLTSSQPVVGRYLRQIFATQAYLWDELFLRFYGTHRPLQHLSDGGHFENMALYELLRPERGIRLIVACDCGCDPQYQFNDLANLIRLTRTDFGIEIEVDNDVTLDTTLGPIFGTPEQFQFDYKDDQDRPTTQKCALLLNVFHSQESRQMRRPNTRVVVMKPRFIPTTFADLRQYHATHSAFPQEPTTDPFHKEAQWESYRKLGLETAKLVFGVGASKDLNGYREALWRALLVK